MKSERGNIIVYLLVGILLFGALVGTVWWVKNRVANDAPQTPVATTDQQQKPETETKVDQDSTPATTPEQSPATPDADPKPATETPPASTPAPAPETTTAGRGSDSANVLPPESQTPRTGPSPSNVAASGPLENAMGTSVGLGVLAYLATSFVRSRKSAH